MAEGLVRRAERFRDRTPYYAKVIGKDKIDYADRTVEEYSVEMQYAIDAGIDYFAYCWYDRTPPSGSIVTNEAAQADGHISELTTARQLHEKSPLRNRLYLGMTCRKQLGQRASCPLARGAKNWDNGHRPLQSERLLCQPATGKMPPL